MADSRFFPAPLGPISLADLATIIRAKLVRGDGQARLSDVRNLETAGPEHVSFFTQPRPVYLDQLEKTQAGAMIVAEKHVEKVPQACAVLVSDSPHLSMTLVMRAFYPLEQLDAYLQSPEVQTEPVHASASVGQNARIEPGALIEAGVEVGDNCFIGANAVIRAGVKIGHNVRIGANAVVSYAYIDDGCVINPGAVIGSAGFGFTFDPQTSSYVDIPHLGVVRLGKHVHVGDNACIARGSSTDTVLSDGVRIDNMVQVAHNVHIGPLSVVAGNTSLAGSVTVGTGVQIGGNSALTNHIHIGDGAKIGGMTGVATSVDAGKVYIGMPAMEQRAYHRLIRAQRNMVRKQSTEDE